MFVVFYFIIKYIEILFFYFLEKNRTKKGVTLRKQDQEMIHRHVLGCYTKSVYYLWLKIDRGRNLCNHIMVNEN